MGRGFGNSIDVDTGEQPLDPHEHGAASAQSAAPGGLTCLCHALILPIRLRLHPVQTAVFFDTAHMSPDLDTLKNLADEDLQGFFARLTAAFDRLEFIPSPKGERIGRLRRKLHSLGRSSSNEVVMGGLRELIVRSERADSRSPGHQPGMVVTDFDRQILRWTTTNRRGRQPPSK